MINSRNNSCLYLKTWLCLSRSSAACRGSLGSLGLAPACLLLGFVLGEVGKEAPALAAASSQAGNVAEHRLQPWAVAKSQLCSGKGSAPRPAAGRSTLGPCCSLPVSGLQKKPPPFPTAPGVALTRPLNLQHFQSLALILINNFSKEHCVFASRGGLGWVFS